MRRREGVTGMVVPWEEKGRLEKGSAGMRRRAEEMEIGCNESKRPSEGKRGKPADEKRIGRKVNGV